MVLESSAGGRATPGQSLPTVEVMSRGHWWRLAARAALYGEAGRCAAVRAAVFGGVAGDVR